MKNFLLVTFAFVLLTVLSGCLTVYRTAYNTFNDPPGSRWITMTFHVTDPDGVPVKNATIHANFWDNFYCEYRHKECRTNKKGIASVSAHSSGGLKFWAKAPEYYDHTVMHIQTPIEKTEKKALTQFTHHAIMKPIRNPVPMILGGDLAGYALPELGKYYGVDLEKASLVKPYGNGTKTDVLVVYDKQSKNENGVHCSIEYFEISVTNLYDGFIPFETDQTSGMQTPYEAPENGYTNKFIWGVLKQDNQSFRIGPYEGMTNEVKITGAPLNAKYEDGVFFRVRSNVSEGKKSVLSAKYGWFDSSMFGFQGREITLRMPYRLNMDGTRNLECSDLIRPPTATKLKGNLR